MQKVFGMLLIVGGLWLGLEVYQKGVAGAFGGLFARAGLAEAPAPGAEPYRPPGERAADRVRGAYQAGWDRGEAPEAAAADPSIPGSRAAARARAMADR
jgi:hypothetical protein